MRVRIHVTPRSRADAVEAARDGGNAFIRVRVTAPPENGRANDAVVALLAKRLGVPRRMVRVAGGGASRVKWIEVDGLEEDELWRRLAPEAAS